MLILNSNAFDHPELRVRPDQGISNPKTCLDPLSGQLAHTDNLDSRKPGAPTEPMERFDARRDDNTAVPRHTSGARQFPVQATEIDVRKLQISIDKYNLQQKALRTIFITL